MKPRSHPLKPQSPSRALSPGRLSLLAGALFLILPPAGTPARGEDSDDFRTYIQWRSYEWDTIWGVDDANGFSVGANLNGHWGVELALDAFQLGLRNTDSRLTAELSSVSLVPQVRYRLPFYRDRLVPYFIAGAGATLLQFNDRKSAGFGVDIDAEDWKAVIAGGAGIEYFLDDNITFGFEGKYQWIDTLDTRIGTVEGTRDMSSFLLSFGLRMYFEENHPRPLADLPGRPAPSRFYFGVRAGGRLILDGDWGNGIELTPLPNAWGHSINQHYGITIGANLSRNWAAELAIDGGETSIKIDGRYTVGEYAQAAFMPQIRYRWPIAGGRWVPYVQVGGGLIYAEFNDAKPQSVLFPGLDPKGFYPVVRGGTGFEYFFTRNFSLGLEANYQYTWDHEISLPGRGTTTGDFSMFQALAMFHVYLFDL